MKKKLVVEEKKSRAPEVPGIYTIVRLAEDATVERACQLAHIEISEVNLIQRSGEITPKNLPDTFRIVSFDGRQMTISERIDGERRVRGFAVSPS